MPQLLITSQVPVKLSVLESDLAKEELFLSYTWERAEGPAICRTGEGPPYMQLIGGLGGEPTSHPFGLRLETWLIQEIDREQEKKAAEEALKMVQSQGLPERDRKVLERTVEELGLIRAHDEVFKDRCPEHEIVAMQGCGDLTMNSWNVAFVNDAMAETTDKPSLICLPDEPLDRRTYPALVKWRERRRVSIEEVKFSRRGEAGNVNKMVWVRNRGSWLPRGEAIHFAVTNQPVLREGEVVPAVTICHRFGDLRHLIKMPNLNPRATLFTGDPGRPREYFNKLQHGDIWLGEKEFLDDERRNLLRAALAGPLLLALPAGASEERLRGAMNVAGYREAVSAAVPLRSGDWRLVYRSPQQQLLEIYFRRNTDAWTMIGLSQDNRRLFCLAVSGKAGESGYTLEEAARKLREAGAWNALLIDEGDDVFQKLTDGADQLLDRVPCYRRRLRAVFIIARPRRQRAEGTSPTAEVKASQEVP